MERGEVNRGRILATYLMIELKYLRKVFFIDHIKFSDFVVQILD